MEKPERIEGDELARKFASFAQRHRFGVDLWKFKNVIIGLLFMGEADPESFGVIADELFSEGDQPPKYSSVRELIETEISYGAYPWVNQYIDWESCFVGYTQEEIDPILCCLVEEIDAVLLAGDVDIGTLYMALIENFGLLGGKAFGEFYTPETIVTLIGAMHSKVSSAGAQQSVYDPACGCGNLYTPFAKRGAECYGQDINPQTIYLTKMNLILNGCANSTVDIRRGDTLVHDMHKGLKVDIAVLNPPFNVRWNNRDTMDFEEYKQWGGYAPNKYGDIGFLQRCMSKLKEGGVGYGIFYPQVMSRQGSEGTIRRHLIHGGYVRAVIDLPSGLFFSTGISTTLLVFTKEPNSHILFVNALKLGRKNQKGKAFTAGEIEMLAEIYRSFCESPHTFVSKRDFAVALELNHPNTAAKMLHVG